MIPTGPFRHDDAMDPETAWFLRAERAWLPPERRRPSPLRRLWTALLRP